MANLMLFVPGVVMALILGYWVRRVEVRGIASDVPLYSLNQMVTIAIFAVLFLPIIICLALVSGVRVDDIAAASLASSLTLRVLYSSVRRLMVWLVPPKILA
jgi:hypothetical protein